MCSHCGVEVTESSTNKQHTISKVYVCVCVPVSYKVCVCMCPTSLLHVLILIYTHI
jgi:hypothetical protein